MPLAVKRKRSTCLPGRPVRAGGQDRHGRPRGQSGVLSRRFGGLGEARLSVVEAFWLATACGGEALGLRVLLGAAQPVDGIDAGAGSVGVSCRLL